MPILGAALRAELVDALGLRTLRKDLFAELRGLARELKAVRTVLHEATSAAGRGSTTGAQPQAQPIAGAEIRAARESFGDSRIVARLQRLLATRPARSRPALQGRSGQVVTGSAC